MEYEDDEQFAPLFLSQKIEEVLKEELMRNVDARHYLEFQKQLEVDLVKMAQQESLEAARTFILTKLGKFGKPPATLACPPETKKPTPAEEALDQEYAADV